MDFDAENENLIGIFTTDERFVVRVWDAALERLTGISAEVMRGKSILETIPDLEERGLLVRFKRVLEEGTVEILAPAFHRYLIRCQPQFASKHFTEMRQRVTIAPLRENEIIRGLMVTLEDVTGRMEQEIELAEKLKNPDESVRLQTAKALSDKPENLAEEAAVPIIEALADKNWRVRRELVEGLSRRAAPDAIAALLQAIKENHFDFGVLNSALQILQATSVKTTETLIEFLQGTDADLRMQAALTLGEQKDTQAIPALLNALHDENVNVRYHAIEALGKLQAREAARPLLAIAEMRDFFLSFAALSTLAKIEDESIITGIIPLLEVDFLREAAIETLGAIGNEEIAPVLISLLNEDSFSALPVSNALSNLAARYENEQAKSAGIIEQAQAAISETGKLNLLEALNNANETNLIPVIRVAAWFDDEEIRRQLAALLENEEVREEAAQALVRQGERAVDILVEKLEGGDPEIRPIAARILGESKSGRSVPALIEALETDSDLTAEAALALGQIGDGRAFEPLVELLMTGDSSSRQSVTAALKLLAHPETVSRLCDLFADADAGVRESVIRVIGHLGAKDCEDAIFESCEDEDERVRKAAVEQLPLIHNERAVLRLIDILKQDSPRVRAAAAQALGQIKTEAAAAALREALTDEDAWTRYFAVRSLGALTDIESHPKLVEMAENDTAQQVRQAATEVLGNLEA